MGLNELLEQIRDSYLENLYAVVDEKGAPSTARVIAEPALRHENGALAVEGTLELPVRTDIAVLQNEALAEMLNVEPESLVNFDPVEFDWGKTLHIEMGPFAWQSFTLTMPADSTYNWAPMQDWFWKWFREEDDEPSGGALLGAVHFLSDPVYQDDVVEFAVDLGSAPITAFEEMLDALSLAGVSLCAIGEVLGEDAGE